MSEIVKIGITERNPVKRAKELQTTGVPTPYAVAAYWTVDDSHSLEIESEIHNLLHKFRISNKREFFRIPLDQAQAIISNFLKTDEEIEQNRKLQKEVRLEEEEAILKAEKKRQDQKKKEAEAEAAWKNIKDAMWDKAHNKAEQILETTSKECHIIINSKLAKITRALDIILWSILVFGTFFILPFILYIISERFNIDFSKISFKPKKVKKAESDLQKISAVTDKYFNKYRREHFIKCGILNPNISDNIYIV